MISTRKYAGKERKSQSHRGLKIRPRGKSWQVDYGTRKGTRDQRSYKSLEDAKRAIQEHVLHRADMDRMEATQRKDRLIGWHILSERQKIDAVTAFDLLDGRATLDDAVRHYLQTVPDADNQRTVREVFDIYLGSKEASGVRPNTISDYRVKIGRLARDLGERPMHGLSSEDLEKWLNRHGYRGTTRRNYRRHLKMFWDFALSRQFIRRNVVDGISKVAIDEKLPEIFTIEQTRRLMRHVEDHAPMMTPYFAIGNFAGLRPNELASLDWQDIDVGKLRIRVRPEVAKKRRQRYVQISDNLADWLVPHRQETGRVFFSRHWFDRGRGHHRNKDKSDPVVPWADDIMRHTYGSYHLAFHEDAPRTALQIGHTTQGILFDHYRDLVTSEDAAAFWDIRPRVEDAVIRFPAG